MDLSTELISQFVKATNDETKSTTESIVNGTTIEQNDVIYVKLDGSDLLTPITTTANIKNNERVTVLIKNHTATVTGNITAPSASSEDVEEVDNKITEFEIVMAHKVTTEDLEAINATIESLTSKIANIGSLTATDLEAYNAAIKKLEAKFAEIEYVDATNIDAINAEIENLEAVFGSFTSVSTEDLEALNAYIGTLKGYTADFTYVSAEVLDAVKATIKELDVNKLSVEDAEIKYANIDFANINEAAIKKIFADTGLIKDIIVGDGTITGELVGVTIRGDLIEGNTIVADKLVIKGSDGLYYKLNTDGVTTETEQTDYNSLNGQVIMAKSITATKISVDDLVAFDATIGGFNITTDSIFSGVKESPLNTTKGVYMDKEGQFSIGDSSSFMRYYKDSNGKYVLEISANSIKISSSDSTIEDAVNNAIVSTVEEFYQSSSHSELIGGTWSTIPPEWEDGMYIWRRTLITYGDKTTKYTPSEKGICITGNTGSDGEDSVILQILSSNGNLFKNSLVATTLSVTIIIGGEMITSSRDMYLYFGNQSKLIWEQKRFGETEFTTIADDDPRLNDNGFILTINPQDVYTQTVFNCKFVY